MSNMRKILFIFSSVCKSRAKQRSFLFKQLAKRREKDWEEEGAGENQNTRALGVISK